MSRARDLAAFVSNADGDIKFDTDTLFIDSSANRVGIGTNSPDRPLHVTRGDGTGTVVKVGNTGTSSATIEFSDTGTTDTVSVGSVGNDLTLKSDDGDISFNTTGDPATASLYVERGGNIGIGTTSPARPFSVTDQTSDGTGGMILASYLPTLEMDDISGGGTSFILQHNQTNTIFKHGTTERMRILSGGGITFNGDTAAANALDDYEEGTWTPAFTNIGTGTYSIQVGYYVKIGNLVNVQCHLDIASKGTASGNLAISGFPFAAKNVSALYGISSSIHGTSWTNQVSGLNLIISNNSTTSNNVYKNMANTSGTTATHDDLGVGNFLFSMTYYTQ